MKNKFLLIAMAIMTIALFAACNQPDEKVSVASVTLNKTSLTMTVGGEETLIATIAPSNATNQNVEWSSNVPSVVEVANGKVTAKTAGSGTITVKTQDGGKTATCTVTVNAITQPPENKLPVVLPKITGTGVTAVDANTFKVSLENIDTRGIALNGLESSDPDAVPGDTLKYAWVQVGASPSAVTITNNAGATTTITGIKKAGDYTFALTVTDKDEGVSETKNVTLKVEPYTVTKNVNVAAVPFTVGTELKFKVDGGATSNFSFVGGATDGLVAADLNGITYTLSSTNPVKDLSDCSNGNIPSSKYADGEYPTITQTFYYNGQVVGSRKVVTFMEMSRFVTLHEYKPTQIDGVWYDSDFVDIYAIPPVTLTLSKTITEILPPPNVITKTITVPAITYGAGLVPNPLNFGAVPAPAGGWDANFSTSDVTYTLTLSKGGTTIATVESTSATSISASGRASGVYTLTQTFKYKGNPITGGSRDVAVEIYGNTFIDMYVSESDFTAGSFTALTLGLSKDSL